MRKRCWHILDLLIVSFYNKVRKVANHWNENATKSDGRETVAKLNGKWQLNNTIYQDLSLHLLRRYNLTKKQVALTAATKMSDQRKASYRLCMIISIILLVFHHFGKKNVDVKDVCFCRCPSSCVLTTVVQAFFLNAITILSFPTHHFRFHRPH